VDWERETAKTAKGGKSELQTEEEEGKIQAFGRKGRLLRVHGGGQPSDKWGN